MSATANKHRISRDDLARGGRIAAANRKAAKQEARLAALDARYEGLVDTIAAGLAPTREAARILQADRNCQVGRLRRRGLPRLRTVAEETRATAEDMLLNMIASRAGDPAIDALQAEIDEAYELRAALAARQDDPFLPICTGGSE